MTHRGPTWYPGNTSTDSPATNVRDIATSSPGVLTTGTLTGSTSAATLLQIIPPTAGSTTLTTASAAGTTLANNKGWWIPPTTEMGSTSSVNRTIPSGSVLTVACRAVCTGLTGNNTLYFTAYKRSAAGVLTQICSGNTTAANGAGGTTTNANFNSNSVAAEVVFAAGETLYIELYVQIASQTLTAGTMVYSLNQGSASWQLPNQANGIDYRTYSSLAVVGSGSFDQYIRGVGKSLASSGTGASSMGPRSVAKAPVAFLGTGSSSLVKDVTPTPIPVIGVGSFSSMTRQVGVKKLVFGAGSTVDINKVILLPKVAIGVGTAVVSRTTSALRSFSIVGTGTPGFARAVITARTFMVAGAGAASAVIGIPQVVLNRILGGGGTVVKKILMVFDDN